MLVDTGYAGNKGRDAIRIAAAAESAGVERLDYLVITHITAITLEAFHSSPQSYP